ncbi:DHA2 family efflux MFS transporter permease subunit [Noviherbaspirillum galbum]|uniref:DHA2 family efflux MFS transporter permease subunit n=1 Tax=Noviherbaspirillum galbum TaxID=2709383 RepID=A0A6B3SRA4_9BURK|nr:DHA2 family efflux MFS transporter permease subunit [Noviherbaspirillum galbum]NEX63283.1 DHA2 family efflux MFS transporter permease subunit [Noviherbaspirillum galbum]
MPAAQRSSRLFITLAVMSATLIQVLDTTIVNVALPHMQGELGATSDQISWVLTSYLVSSAIFMPLTGYFSDVLGRKRYLLVCIAGFVAASALCGVAMNVGQIVAFRLLQGVFGAALVPLSQAIMGDAYPPDERGKAMAIWGLGVMVGPVLGPTLGGWLTEIASWRWTFYINVPVGALSWFLASQFVPETERRERRMDWTGLSLLAVGIAGLQYALDRGNQQDWFAGKDIVAATVLGAGGTLAFAWYSLRYPGRALFDIRIFKDRNFGMACLVMAALGLGMYGGMVIQPILLEGLLGYPIVTTGLVMAPRGIATAVSMMVVGRMVGRTDPRYLVATGMMLSAAGSWAMTRYSLDINTFWIIWPAMLQGLGLGLIFVPLSTVAYATLDRARMAEAAGLYSLVRTMGSAVGISVITTLLSRQSQVVWNELGGHVQRYNPALTEYLRSLHLSPTDPKAIALIAAQVAQQAEVTAMLDVFKLITWSFVLMLPLVLVLRRNRRPVDGMAATPQE